jgi:hypothetical protein
LLLRWAGPTPMAVVLFILLTLFFIYILAMARVLLLTRRPRLRPFGSPGGRGDLSGVREPRRPRPPHWPPRAAAAVPEDTQRQESTGPVGYSDSPQQPLRLEDGLA